MKKLLSIILFLPVIIGCSNYENSEIDYSTSEIFSPQFKELQKVGKLKLIALDSLKTYSDLISEMQKSTCADKVPGLVFSNKKTNYHLVGFTYCPASNSVGCYFRVNSIIISESSVIADEEIIDIDQFDDFLNELMANPLNYQYDENKLKPAIIRFYAEETYPIGYTKEVLSKISAAFDKINGTKEDFFTYTILFKNRKYRPIPPPPPPPKI